MSKVDDFETSMAEIFMSIDEQSEFRDRFIEDLLLENHDLKEQIKNYKEQIKFLLRGTRKL